jgi:hypothetical protein
MRGAPQSGLASAMVRTRFASSEPTDGRPVRPRREFQVQKARKPCRCQRITVSGRTRWSASRHAAQWLESHTQKRRGARIVSRRTATEQGKLLPERQVLDREIGAGSERRAGCERRSFDRWHCACLECKERWRTMIWRLRAVNNSSSSCDPGPKRRAAVTQRSSTSRAAGSGSR